MSRFAQHRACIVFCRIARGWQIQISDWAYNRLSLCLSFSLLASLYKRVLFLSLSLLSLASSALDSVSPQPHIPQIYPQSCVLKFATTKKLEFKSLLCLYGACRVGWVGTTSAIGILNRSHSKAQTLKDRKTERTGWPVLRGG